MKVATFPSGAMTWNMALGGGAPERKNRGNLRTRIVREDDVSHARDVGDAKVGRYRPFVGLGAMAFDPDYAKRLGLNVDDLVVCQPETGEMALEVVDTLVRSAAVDLICVDSVALVRDRKLKARLVWSKSARMRG